MLIQPEPLGTDEGAEVGALRRQRRTAKAEFLGNLDAKGVLVSWGVRLFNGNGEQQITILFPNPFLTDDQRIAKTPDWSRLAMSEDLSRRYLFREPDPKDRSSEGFSHG